MLENATVHSFVFLSHMSLSAVSDGNRAVGSPCVVIEIFCTAVKNIKLLKSSYKVPNIFVRF